MTDSDSFHSAADEFTDDEVASVHAEDAVDKPKTTVSVSPLEGRENTDVGGKTIADSFGNESCKEPREGHNKSAVQDTNNDLEATELPTSDVKSCGEGRSSDVQAFSTEDCDIVTSETIAGDEAADGWDDWDVDETGSELAGCDAPQTSSADADNEEGAVAPASQTDNEKKSFWNGLTRAVASVGESLSNIVESGIGAPSPEDLATTAAPVQQTAVPKLNEGVNINAYGEAVAGFGANIMTSSLDVLEALGKKAFEKITVSERETERLRLMFEPDGGQDLSEVLKKLRETEQAQCTVEANAVSKRKHTFINFFERSDGFVHLEGLELLSKHHMRKIGSHRKREVDSVFANTLSSAIQDCQSDEDFMKQFEIIILATGLPYNILSLPDCDSRCTSRLQKFTQANDREFSEFLDFTAQSVQCIHRLSQLLLISDATRRQDPFSELLVLLGRRISFYCNSYAHQINTCAIPGAETEELITAVFLAEDEAYSYIQQSFRLLRPFFVL